MAPDPYASPRFAPASEDPLEHLGAGWVSLIGERQPATLIVAAVDHISLTTR